MKPETIQPLINAAKSTVSRVWRIPPSATTTSTETEPTQARWWMLHLLFANCGISKRRVCRMVGMEQGAALKGVQKIHMRARLYPELAAKCKRASGLFALAVEDAKFGVPMTRHAIAEAQAIPRSLGWPRDASTSKLEARA